MKNLFTLLFLTGAICSCFFSCTKDKGRLELSCKNLKTTYSKDIVPLVATNCAISGCHTPTAFMGDLSLYDVLKAKVDDGSFKLRVLDLKVMPPISRPPLSEEDLAKISCWLSDGAPNN